jgi:hypothetical protein
VGLVSEAELKRDEKQCLRLSPALGEVEFHTRGMLCLFIVLDVVSGDGKRHARTVVCA